MATKSSSDGTSSISSICCNLSLDGITVLKRFCQSARAVLVCHKHTKRQGLHNDGEKRSQEYVWQWVGYRKGESRSSLEASGRRS